MKWYLIAVATFHAAIALCEWFPWSRPVLLRMAGKNLPDLQDGQKWTGPQTELVSTIVHNAGIYNAALAGGLLWSALPEQPLRDVAGVLFASAAAAGIFGTATMRSIVTAIQACLGIAGLALL